MCLETGDEGVFIAQPRLASALRVNSIFFLAAAPHLYRSPIVYNIDSFFLGANSPAPIKTEKITFKQSCFSVSSVTDDVDNIKAGNTKLPLLRHVRRLNIIPRLGVSMGPRDDEWPNAEVDNPTETKKRMQVAGNLIYGKIKEQDRYMDSATRILSSIPLDLIITPQLDSLTLGTCIFADNIGSYHVPKKICEYNLDSRSEVRAMDIEDGILPKLIIVHNEPHDKKGFPVYWGTRNRIMVRSFEDANPDDDPREKSLSSQGHIEEPEDAILRGIMFGEISVQSTYPAWLTLKTPIKAKVDKATIVIWVSKDSESDPEEESHAESDQEDSSSVASWSTVECQHKKEQRQKKALEKIERIVMDEMTKGYNTQGWRGRRAPTLKLYLANGNTEVRSLWSRRRRSMGLESYSRAR
ncbi:uncharacterized protein IL334_007860 [Kwoniella shivajii]|uniref:Uncharacterized protein n=1 Tax=Kwoniella shivajii TaxID=564305 RepID=A0ABZ1DAM4_9TREE|nr:hypothetical protein IL334_007860 [Kwoniella shivajii]